MKNKYVVFVPVLYKSQTINFVLHTLLARARFPALGVGYMHLFGVLIGSTDFLRPL